ncbi:S1 family peptidase [Leifsonia sp. EB34]|uniref:S1 family peptidase n=1 Tax=Leifsonia sp. EB34 TaxID=3156303 RepID=UPI003512906B
MRSKRLATTAAVIVAVSVAATVLAGCAGPSGGVRAGAPSSPHTAGGGGSSAAAVAPSAPATAPSEASPQSPDPSTLPDGLKAAIGRDLHITPQQYLAGAQAAAAAPATIAALTKAGVDPAQVWLDGSVLKVHTADAHQQEVAHALGAEPTSSTPPTPPAVTTASSYEDLVNGSGWYLPVGSSSIAICSTGFNGWNASGAATVATAGHCLLGNSPVPAAPVTATRYVQSQPNQTGTSGSTIGDLEYNSFQFGSGYDSGLIDVSNPALAPKPQVSTWDGNAIAVRGTITATVGAYVCKSGRTTGWTCGTVQRVNYSQGISSGQAVNSVQTSMCMYHGDSGGPAMIGFYAVGVNSSGTWSSTACTDAGGYSAIYPVQGNANSIVSQQTGWEPMVTVDAPTVSGVTPGSTTVLTGSLPNVATGDSVSVYVDGASAAAGTAAVATSGAWSVSLSGQAAGAHTYRVVAGWGTRNRSAATTGSYTVAGTPTPTATSTPTGTPAPTGTPTPTTGPLIPGYPTGSFIKTATSGTVYIVGPTDIKPVSSWGALLALMPRGASPVIRVVAASVIAGVRVGPTALTSGTLVRSPADATVYLVNGLTNKIPFSSFDIPTSIGINGFGVVDSAVLAGYPTAGAAMGYGITCGGTDYVAAAGTLRALDASTKPLYPLVYTPLDSYTCALLSIGSPATKFIRTPNGSIFLLDSGKKLPIASMARFSQLGGSVGYVNVTAGLAATIPTGPLA